MFEKCRRAEKYILITLSEGQHRALRWTITMKNHFIYYTDKQFIESLFYHTWVSCSQNTNIYLNIWKCFSVTLRKRSYLKGISPPPIFLIFSQVAAVAPEPQATLSNCNGDPQWQQLANESLAVSLPRMSTLLKCFLYKGYWQFCWTVIKMNHMFAAKKSILSPPLYCHQLNTLVFLSKDTL